MKSLQLLFFCVSLLFSANVLAQPLPIGSKSYYAPSSLEPIYLVGKSDYFYDSNDNLVRIVGFREFHGHSYLSGQILFEYNSSQQITKQTTQNWNSQSNNWVNYRQFVTTYYPSGEVNVFLHQIHDTITNTWLNDYRHTYSINADGNKETVTEQWNNNWETTFRGITHQNSMGQDTMVEEYAYLSFGSINYAFRYRYQYDHLGRQIKRYIDKWLINNEWRPSESSTNVFDDNSSVSYYQLDSNWSTTQNTWSITSRTIHQQVDTNTITHIKQYSQSQGQIWNNSVKITNYASSLEEYEQIDHWNSDENDWKISYKSIKLFNPDGSRDSFITQDREYNASQNFYTASTLKFIYTPTSTKPQPLQAKISLSPNPTTDHLIVKVDTNTATKPYQITLIDSQGRVLEQQFSILTENRLSLREYSAGYYILQISQNGATKSIPVIKQ
jgi:hypothetical protein